MRKSNSTRLLVGLLFVSFIMGVFSCSSSKKAKVEIENQRTSTAELPPPVVKNPTTCANIFINPQKVVYSIADSLMGLRIMYSNNPDRLADCSGIFHRFLLSLKRQCGQLDLPPIENARSSRAIARWYADRGKLAVVTNALVQSHLIKPGKVLFFGHRWTKYDKLSLADVLSQTYHLAICVEVTHDRNGVVQSYKLFHGRRTGKTAMITDWHKRRPSRANLPALGNWDEQLIGIAPVFILKDGLVAPAIVTEKKGTN